VITTEIATGGNPKKALDEFVLSSSARACSSRCSSATTTAARVWTSATAWSTAPASSSASSMRFTVAEAVYRLPRTDERYGLLCPRCAGPKSVQASECRSCWFERRRGANYWSARSCPDCGGPKYPDRSVRCRRCADACRVPVRAGRPQPQDHPWRKDRNHRDSGVDPGSRGSHSSSKGLRAVGQGLAWGDSHEP
jgi:hypothetical protein